LVGPHEKLEGIVSRPDINGALSPYLQPMFAKWRRPLDDATLQIKIKWIMNRVFRTIAPDTPLTEIARNIRHEAAAQPLAVIDQHGKVCGLVALFDITRALLNGAPIENAK